MVQYCKKTQGNQSVCVHINVSFTLIQNILKFGRFSYVIARYSLCTVSVKTVLKYEGILSKYGLTY
jgi:hypothetical protein